MSFLKTQWQGIVGTLVALLMLGNVLFVLWAGSILLQRSAEAHAVFESMKQVIEQQQKLNTLREKKPE
jgi:TRAP-type C4-dicarboxylate transport system permease small subunit